MTTPFPLTFVFLVVIHMSVWVVVVIADPQVPCFFIFGDSLSDSGNNNGLSTLARANFYPYGVDFPAGPTGRFTNGRTTVDLISEYVGIDGYIPPYSSVSGEDVLKGVNYASGSSGILTGTGSGVGGRIPIDKQLENHGDIKSRISQLLGNDTGKVDDHMSKCLYSVYAGSNDYMLNYFMARTASSIVGFSDRGAADATNFTDSLVTRYSQQLKTLYDHGARKVVVFGLGPLGCLPLLNRTDGCSKPINDALEIFNGKVLSLVDGFNKDLPDARFIFIDSMKIISPDLSALGVKVTNAPCCGVRQIFCLPLSAPCSDRNEYAYWDNAHPTEAANKVLANRAYTAQHPTDAHPTDISHLVGDNNNGSNAASGNKSKRSTTIRNLTLFAALIICNIMLRLR